MNQPKLLDPRITTARETYCCDDLVVDDDADIRDADGGCWVAAWLWLPNED